MKFINRIKKNKILTVLGVSIIAVFIALVTRFTYAFLAANINEASGNITLNSDETDKLDFALGDPLSIDATPTTLPENGSNLVDTTTATATLLANTTNNTAEYTYWVYFTISNNTFVYSDGSTPEIILTVTDPSGNPVTNIDGLTYGTFNGVAGFDITSQNGTFTVANGYTISSDSSTDVIEQTWKFTLTYLNLPTDQSVNFGNSMTTEVSMSKEEYVPTLAEHITSLYTSDGANGLYLHDGAGTYGAQEAGDGSYRYAGANPNNYVCFGSDATTCPNDNLYRIIGVFGDQVKLIKHDYAGSNLLGTNGAYQGTASPSSYSTYKGSQSTLYWYYWNNSTYVNVWSQSNLNTVNLNTNYLNNIGSTWSSKIATTNWNVGGNTVDNIYNVPVKKTYQNEIVSPAENTTYSAKIGLMYTSDYGYSASPDNWNTNLYDYDNDTNRNNNWMYMGWYDWTVSPCRSDDMDDAFVVGNTGIVDYASVVDVYGVRPSFYLESSVAYSSGNGTQENPYRIA